MRAQQRGHRPSSWGDHPLREFLPGAQLEPQRDPLRFVDPSVPFTRAEALPSPSDHTDERESSIALLPHIEPFISSASASASARCEIDCRPSIPGRQTALQRCPSRPVPATTATDRPLTRQHRPHQSHRQHPPWQGTSENHQMWSASALVSGSGGGQPERRGHGRSGEHRWRSTGPRSRKRRTAAEDEVLELERELCRLPEISAARVVTDDERPPDRGPHPRRHRQARQAGGPRRPVGRAGELRHRARPPHRLRRASSEARQWQRRSPRRPPAADPAFRPVLVNTTAEVSGLRSLVRVTLARGDNEAVGFAEGSSRVDRPPPPRRHRDRRRAAPARDGGGVHRRRQRPDRARRRPRRRDRHGGVRAPAGEQLVSGSAIVRQHAEADTVVRAVLDATNRRLPSLG